jgi:hypothetical protein
MVAVADFEYRWAEGLAEFVRLKVGYRHRRKPAAPLAAPPLRLVL